MARRSLCDGDGCLQLRNGVIYLPASLIAGTLWVVKPERCLYRGRIRLAGGNRQLRVAATGPAIEGRFSFFRSNYSATRA